MLLFLFIKQKNRDCPTSHHQEPEHFTSLCNFINDKSLSRDIRISFSVYISMKASRRSCVKVVLSLFFINLSVEKVLSHATWLKEEAGTCRPIQLHDRNWLFLSCNWMVVFGEDPIHTNCTCLYRRYSWWLWAPGHLHLKKLSCSPDSVGLQMGQLYTPPLVGQIIELGLEPSSCGAVVKSTELFQGFSGSMFLGLRQAKSS